MRSIATVSKTRVNGSNHTSKPTRALPPATARRLPRGKRVVALPQHRRESSLAPAELFPVSSGTAGDHHAIYDLLSTALPSATRDGFLTSLDDPFYEPCHRLVIRHGGRVLSHAHLSPRTMRLGQLPLRVSVLSGLATWPEYRGMGLARRLLVAAERSMADDGAVLGMLRTNIPHFFRAAGWAVCGRHSISRARTRDLLAQLVPMPDTQSEQAPLVRPWRQVELPALMRLHQSCNQSSSGSFERTEPYWRWLISRKHFDQIFVAIHGPDRQELDDVCLPIVGYVVVRGQEVLELVSDPAHPRAAEQLLARACGEAIERDFTTLVYHAPPSDKLHERFLAAGGSRFHHESSQGEVFMMKLLDPIGFLRQLCGQLHERAEQSNLPRPCELGLLLQGQKHRLAITRRSVKLAGRRLGRSYLSMNDAEFTRLLLGHVRLDEAVASGRVEASTRVAFEMSAALFPQLPLWHSPLDEVCD
jgi:ribosomal protein S18 acetylase RimI-like enzyme